MPVLSGKLLLIEGSPTSKAFSLESNDGGQDIGTKQTLAVFALEIAWQQERSKVLLSHTKHKTAKSKARRGERNDTVP